MNKVSGSTTVKCFFFFLFSFLLLFFFHFWEMDNCGYTHPFLFQTQVGGGKMQTSSPPVITPNRSQSNPDDMITLPRPIQSVGMDLHDVSGTSTGQTLPRERRAPPATHFCPTIWWVYPHLLLFLSSTPYDIVYFFIHFCPKYQAAAARILRAGPQDPKRQAS